MLKNKKIDFALATSRVVEEKKIFLIKNFKFWGKKENSSMGELKFEKKNLIGNWILKKKL